MVFFKNSTVYLTTKTKAKNKIGQLIEVYKKDKAFYGDIQPIDEKALKYTWGEDIKANLQLFADENTQVNEIIVCDDKSYKIEKRIDWIDYKIYALLEADVEVLNEESK
ncbi:hypothetical protein [Clostridium sp.]|uniref:hypothetical protein n=1 Tax=Clostridium sp. TaxID=1506 RepID=UPI001D2EF294|nr:hypothetical protein [Clostridium sp.]MBS5937757.1 hypothetical protein [Clostridium sp.]